MAKLYCVPLYLYPSEYLSFSRCKVIPGVTLSSLTANLKTAIDGRSQNLLVQPGFSQTHAICVDKSEYLAGLAKRLNDEDSQMPSKVFVEADSITKQVMLSLVLVGPITFIFGGIHNFNVLPR